MLLFVKSIFNKGVSFHQFQSGKSKVAKLIISLGNSSSSRFINYRNPFCLAFLSEFITAFDPVGIIFNIINYLYLNYYYKLMND